MAKAVFNNNSAEHLNVIFMSLGAEHTTKQSAIDNLHELTEYCITKEKNFDTAFDNLQDARFIQCIPEAEYEAAHTEYFK